MPFAGLTLAPSNNRAGKRPQDRTLEGSFESNKLATPLPPLDSLTVMRRLQNPVQ